MLGRRRIVFASVIGCAVALALTGAVVAGPAHAPKATDWPYPEAGSHASATVGRVQVLAAVGDIACEPDTAENQGTPSDLKCGSPAPGNHEYYAYTKHGDNEAAQDGAGYFAYYNGQDATGAIRRRGQAGTYNKGWYSYDLGAWHIISLNAECGATVFGNDCSTTGPGLFAQETR